MAGFDRDLYEDNCMNVTEEEFVFDSLNNVKLDDIFKAIFGRNGTCLQHQMEFFPQKGGEIVEGAQNDLKLMHLEENVENSLVWRTNAPAVVCVSILP